MFSFWGLDFERTVEGVELRALGLGICLRVGDLDFEVYSSELWLKTAVSRLECVAFRLAGYRPLKNYFRPSAMSVAYLLCC